MEFDLRPLEAILDLSHPRKLEAVQWAAANLNGTSAPGTLDRAAWSAAAEAGFLGLMMPSAYGGSADTATAAMLTFEGLGLGAKDQGTVFALASQVIAMQRALSAFGSTEQLDRWLRPLIRGEIIGAFTMTEPGAGSDTASITTRAVPAADGSHRITGQKAWATLGPVADIAIVFASTAPEAGTWGLTAFLVETDQPGVEVSPATAKAGLAGCPVGSLRLSEVIVGPEHVLGRVGAGSAVFARAVEAERAFLYASQLGATECLIDRAIERARSRRAAGTNIGSHQAVSHRIVDMKLRHESSRLLLYKAAALFDRGQPVTQAAALTKLAASENAVASAVDAMRIFGADGYGRDAGLDDALGDALGGLFYSGTSDVARNIVAGILRLDRPRETS